MGRTSAVTPPAWLDLPRALDELPLLGDLRRQEVEEHPDARGVAQVGMGEEPEVGGEVGIRADRGGQARAARRR